MYRLLIADPDKDICHSISRALAWDDLGFDSIVTAGTYAEALDRCMDLLPHLILVSVELGDAKGYELAAHLRSVGVRTLFGMMSETEDPGDMRRSMQAGALDYLRKPIDPQLLREFAERMVVNELGGTLPESHVVRQEEDPVLQRSYLELSKITNKIILYIRSNYRQSLSLTGIAATFNMSSKYIGRIFLRDTGMKFTEYLMAYRMLEARRLILSTSEKISVVADMVGYSQLNNFYIHFRNYFGVSPSSLRKFDADPE